MIVLAIGTVLWPIACVASTCFFLSKRQFIRGGVALLALSLLPPIYGRAITPAGWHDSPLMGVYYLPTLVTAFVSLLFVLLGLFRLAKGVLSDRTGTF